MYETPNLLLTEVTQ